MDDDRSGGVEWNSLAEDSETATDGPWWVTEDDLVGGWCVRTIGEPPSSGRGITIADFIREEDARLCATARNLTMRTEAIAGIRAALTSDMAIADDGTLYLNPRSSRRLLAGISSRNERNTMDSEEPGHPYTHWMYFNDETKAQACAAALPEHATEIEPVEPSAAAGYTWLLLATRNVLSDQLIKRHVEEEVEQVVLAHGGYYDGGESAFPWETITDDPALTDEVDPDQGDATSLLAGSSSRNERNPVDEIQALTLNRLRARRDNLVQQLAEVNAQIDAVTDDAQRNRLVAISPADWNNLVSYLRELHADAGKPSARKIAKASGGMVSHTSVSEVLRGARVPSWKLLWPIGKVLGANEVALKQIWVSCQMRTADPAQADEVIERLADEAEQGYDIERLRPRGAGKESHEQAD